MQTLLTSAQMREADAYTIKNKPISAINLMESAARAFVKAFTKEIKDLDAPIVVISGTGNNGADGLAIARLLQQEKYKDVKVYWLNFSKKQSDEFKQNLNSLATTSIPVVEVNNPSALELKDAVVIDAILGSGLNKPVEGKFQTIAQLINKQPMVVSVDVPTGLNTEGPIASGYNGIKANLVITFQRPKLNFFFPESIQAMDRFKVVNIGLDETFIQQTESNWRLSKRSDIYELIRARKKFTHKGTYGHALLVAGNIATMGAALLAAKACLHSGAGLTTLCLPQNGLTALNVALPEVMALPRANDFAMEAFGKFNAIAFGPGLGVEEENDDLLQQLIGLKKPLVIDADGLTILSKRNDLLKLLPAGSILTPHMKEFDRLFGTHENWWDRVSTAMQEAKERELVIVLKNQYTFVCLPTGMVHINPTGNPGMANGGMGDVLTGIIVALLAQGYAPAEAAILAIYFHGSAGDELAKKRFIVTASQVAEQLPKTIKRLSTNK